MKHVRQHFTWWQIVLVNQIVITTIKLYELLTLNGTERMKRIVCYIDNSINSIVCWYIFCFCLRINDRSGKGGPIISSLESRSLGKTTNLDFQNVTVIGTLQNPIKIDIQNWTVKWLVILWDNVMTRYRYSQNWFQFRIQRSIVVHRLYSSNMITDRNGLFLFQNNSFVEFLIYDGDNRNHTLAQEFFQIVHANVLNSNATLLYNTLTR